MTEESVSHDDLDAAWEATMPSGEAAAEEPVEEPVEEEVHEEPEKPEVPEGEPEVPVQPEEEPEPELPEEPEDNAVRSKLGRKVQYLEGELEKALGVINQLQQPPAEEEEVDPDMPVTRGDIERIIEQRETHRVQQAQQYADNYNGGLVRLGLDLEESEHAEILKAVETVKDPSRTGNPDIDAQVNFYKAKTVVYEKKLREKSKPVNPLSKNEDAEPENLSPGVETKTKTKSVAMPKLDPESAALVKEWGWDAKRVNEILSGPAPFNLVNPKDG